MLHLKVFYLNSNAIHVNIEFIKKFLFPFRHFLYIFSFFSLLFEMLKIAVKKIKFLRIVDYSIKQKMKSAENFVLP